MAAKARTLILDVDPGHDDAVALLLALRWSGVNVAGVVATAGNQTLERTLANARRVVALAGARVPVASGCEGPLVAPLVTAPSVHGDSGLEGVDLPEMASLSPLAGAELFARAVQDSQTPVTLVATGPLTNVAAFVLGYPSAAARLERVVIMGGGLHGGNVTATAEFNFHADPEAASIVLRAGLMPTLVGLNVTHRALLYRDDIAAIAGLGSRQAAAVATWLEFYGGAYRRRFGWDGVPIHDACAVLEALSPGLVETEPMVVDVETGGALSRGAMVIDRRPLVAAPSANALVGTDIDRNRFVDLLMTGLKKYGAAGTGTPGG